MDVPREPGHFRFGPTTDLEAEANPLLVRLTGSPISTTA